MEVLKYHGLALLIGYVLDLIIGDPHGMPHPIRLIGNYISILEKRIYKDRKINGLYLVILTIVPVALSVLLIEIIAYKLSPIIGTAIESVLVFYCLATKSLKDESEAVIESLETKGIIEARNSLSMIVGRDTKELTEEQILKATVETVAENTSDGVIAPLIYLAILGPVLGLVYKTVNTMDSMVGYKNEKYSNYGFFPARLDDIFNYIPSRICAFLIIIAANIIPGFDGKNAYYIWKRDRINHKSPNSAQSEAAYAGAMGLKLAGGAYYFGKWVEKPFIGEEVKKIDRKDVRRSHILLYGTSILCEVICTAVIFLITM